MVSKETAREASPAEPGGLWSLPLSRPTPTFRDRTESGRGQRFMVERSEGHGMVETNIRVSSGVGL